MIPDLLLKLQSRLQIGRVLEQSLLLLTRWRNYQKASEYTKDIKVIKNKDKRVLITLRDSKTNKLLSAYNIVTTDSSLIYAFGEQDKQISILEPENSKLDINIIRVKGSHGFVDFKDF